MEMKRSVWLEYYGLIFNHYLCSFVAFIFQEEEGSLLIVEPQESELLSANETPNESYKGEHGHLVQQILESQKELSQVSGKTEIVSKKGV